MKHINELSKILNYYLNWNKARVTCLAQMVQSIIKVKTVNLAQIAVGFYSKSSHESSYKRIQRFLRFFDFDQSLIVKIIFSIFPMSRKIILAMDRTNWKWGKIHINILVLSIVYRGVGIPVFWYNLKRAGNSKTKDRIAIVAKIINYIEVKKIKYLLADREFVGSKWFDWLMSSKIRFIIRIKSNTGVRNNKYCKYPVPVSGLFRRLKNCRKKSIKNPFWIGPHKLCLSASRSPIGELLIIATPYFSVKALEFYKRRWEIETLFGCLKSKGFCLEDTRLTKDIRIEKLFFVLTIAFVWAYIAGIEREKKKIIKIKKHGRKSYSLFRYGLEILRKAVFSGYKMRKFMHLFLAITNLKKRGYLCL